MKYKVSQYYLYHKITQSIISQSQFKNMIYLSSVDIEWHLLRHLKLLGDSKQS